jgi:FtsP/CotA-like multicopper oxidase with cupredoxin domain
MSRNQRIGLIVAAVVFAAVAFVIASPGGDDDEGGRAAQTTQTTTQPQSETGEEGTPTETETEEPHETVPPEAEATRIEIRGGEVAGGAADIRVTKGDVVRIVVSSDAHDDIHLHGYDIERQADPGRPARFKFTADVEGIFEIESHVAEDAGKDPLVGKLTVEPS